MADRKDSGPTPLGIYEQPSRARITGVEVIALALTVLWIGAALLFFGVLGSSEATNALSSLQFVMTMLAIFLPVAMIWVAALAARSARVTREESRRLQAAVDALRKAYINQAQGGGATVNEPSVARKLDEIAAAQRKTETALATFTSSRGSDTTQRPAPASAAEEPDDQPTLALGTRVEDIAAPLDTADYIRALNFPETAEDERGFTALRRALKDRQAAQLIRAAQDALTLLSQDGIYMDDLRPDMARPEIWRKFAVGERGRSVAALGGIRDRSSLALTAGRMKQDPIFRDAAHHFLRIFDKNFVIFEETATDADITALSDTRTARAFMLLGRVAGTFD